MPFSVGAARFAWLLSWFLEQGRNHLLLAGLPILLALGALCIGRYIVPPDHVMGILLGQIFPIEPYWQSIEETVVMQIRLPRVILALSIGAGLSVSVPHFRGCLETPLSARIFSECLPVRALVRLYPFSHFGTWLLYR